MPEAVELGLSDKVVELFAGVVASVNVILTLLNAEQLIPKLNNCVPAVSPIDGNAPEESVGIVIDMEGVVTLHDDEVMAGSVNETEPA